MRAAVLLMIVALSIAAPAAAQEYEKGPNGGLMLDVAGVDAELLTSGNSITINVSDAKNHTPIATKGYNAAVLVELPP